MKGIAVDGQYIAGGQMERVSRDLCGHFPACDVDDFQFIVPVPGDVIAYFLPVMDGVAGTGEGCVSVGFYFLRPIVDRDRTVCQYHGDTSLFGCFIIVYG